MERELENYIVPYIQYSCEEETKLVENITFYSFVKEPNKDANSGHIIAGDGEIFLYVTYSNMSNEEIEAVIGHYGESIAYLNYVQTTLDKDTYLKDIHPYINGERTWEKEKQKLPLWGEIAYISSFTLSDLSSDLHTKRLDISTFQNIISYLINKEFVDFIVLNMDDIQTIVDKEVFLHELAKCSKLYTSSHNDQYVIYDAKDTYPSLIYQGCHFIIRIEPNRVKKNATDKDELRSYSKKMVMFALPNVKNHNLSIQASGILFQLLQHNFELSKQELLHLAQGEKEWILNAITELVEKGIIVEDSSSVLDGLYWKIGSGSLIP